MYKVIFSIFLAATALLLISSHQTYASHRSCRATAPLPESIVHDGGVLVPSRLGAEKLTWTVWSSDDAVSRLRNAMLAAEARKDPAVMHIRINVDPSAALHHAVLVRDGLEDDSLQIHVTPR